MKTAVRFFLLMIVFLLPIFALAESARVVTPSGPANMRKGAGKGYDISAYVPNGTVLEADEAGEEWTHVTYKGKGGYIMTKYLRLASDSVGKRLYSNGEVVCVRDSASEDGRILAVLNPTDAMTVSEITESWALVEYDAGVGFVPFEALDMQNESPTAEYSFLTLDGFVPNEAPLFLLSSPEALCFDTLPAGTSVSVTSFSDGWCLVRASEYFGYTSVKNIQLLGYSGDSVPVEDSLRKSADKALKGKLKSGGYYVFRYNAPGGEDDTLLYVDDAGKLSFSVTLSSSGKALLAADYTAFGYSVPGKTYLPGENGTLIIEKSMDSLTPGQRLCVSLDDSVSDITYTLTRGGKTLSESKGVPYTTAWFRPHESGIYQLRVTAKDEAGTACAGSAFIWVTDGEDAAELPTPGTLTVYSQQDGWWANKKYSNHSTLQISGCAIFALSHSLQLLGHAETAALPQSLATTYVACLVDGGTLNASLISRAAKEFKYKTKEDLIKDKSSIISYFDRGAVFSFRVVSGHIAMAAGVSEDGKYVRIIDSAPSATFERIKDEKLYYEDGMGQMIPVDDLSEIPGAKYYFETNAFGGLSYYLPMSYVAKQGVRLILPGN